MPFYPGVYRTGPVGKGGAYIPKFHNCEKCGKKFEEGEKIWKHLRSAGIHSTKIEGYLCERCYDAKFVDV
jgi:hypothetical protein